MCDNTKLSYLRAGDSNIFSYNCAKTNPSPRMKMEFGDSSSIEEKSTAPNQTANLQVYLRVRGGLPKSRLYKIDENVLYEIPGSLSSLPVDSRLVTKYEFSKVFDQKATQEYIFDDIVKHRVLDFINGKNNTLLAYGVSGAGKTYTMIGTAEQPGIIPRSFDYLFRTLGPLINRQPVVKPTPDGKVSALGEMQQTREKQLLNKMLDDAKSLLSSTDESKFREMERRLSSNLMGVTKTRPAIVGVWVSFIEIYNENVFDLCQPHTEPREKLKIGGVHEHIFVKGVNYVYVRSALEAYLVFQFGLQNLSRAATALNQQSSRSHCIFSIRLVTGRDQNHCHVATFNFCDLAGTERAKKTLNVGDRFKESTKINASLSVLARCIRVIREHQNNARKDPGSIPFRESKLTQLFQNPLQGKEDIFMIVTINPCAEMFNDNHQTLEFSSVAQKIVVQDLLSVEEQNDEEDNAESSREFSNESVESEDERDELIKQLQAKAEYFQEELDRKIENYTKIILIREGQLRQRDEEIKTLNTELLGYKQRCHCKSIDTDSSDDDDDDDEDDDADAIIEIVDDSDEGD